MKYMLLLSLFAMVNLFNNAHAVAISIHEVQNNVTVFANTVKNSTGDYYDQDFVSFAETAATDSLPAVVTGSDLTTYAWTPNAHMPAVNRPYIDLGFANNVYNGTGVDLALFFAGNATVFQDGHIENYTFSIMVNGIETELLGVVTSETSDIYNGEFFASYALIDLDNFGIDQNALLGDVRVYMGDSSMPALSALGAYHTTVVPLPISSLLFGSGLVFLSLFRRKNPAD